MAQPKKTSFPKNSDFIDKMNEEFNESSDGSDSSAAEGKSSSEDFAKLLNESFKKADRKISVGDKIRGKILVLGREEVYVSTGTQQDGVISRRELNNPDGTCSFKQDDMIELYVTQVRGGEIRLSRKVSDRAVAGDLEDAFDMMLPIQGRVVEVCKGGVRVNIKGKLAFCPISQIDTKHVENAEEYVGRSLEFRITQFSGGGKNIVVSRRQLLMEEHDLSAVTFLEENKDGDIVQGKVARLEKFGAFVEVAPGLDGLVHISEIAWSRIGDPSEVLTVGQEVAVKLLKREIVNGRNKLSLSIKQAMEAPEKSAGDAKNGDQNSTQGPQANDAWSKFTVGQIVTGKVNRKEVYGIFVQLDPGVTGLFHQSKASEHPEFKYEKLRVGDTVTVQIEEMKREERRISLGVPQDPNADDWRQHPQTQTSFGTLGDQLKSALLKKQK